MALDPLARSSWRGFLDSLRPPAGFELRAAVGTTFGLSFEALVGGLLTMVDAEAEEVVRDPLAGLIAATRLADRIRIFVHEGSISGSIEGVPARLAGLLDRIIVPVRPTSGRFHPKIWLTHYASAVRSRKEHDQIRLFVGSRNLVASSSFELGLSVEGPVGTSVTTLGEEVASVLESCLRGQRIGCPAVKQLADLVRRTNFQTPDEGRDEFRVRWQGSQGHRHRDCLPPKSSRALVFSPFLEKSFIRLMLERTEVLRIVSTATAFRKLDDATFLELHARGRAQKEAATYVVGEDFGREDEGRIDGLHAKLVLVDDGREKNCTTFLGSGNATGAGWGLTAARNVECMVELKPGLPMDRLVQDFVMDRKGAPRPWIQEFELGDRIPLSDEENLQDRLREDASKFAAIRLRVSYDQVMRVLTVDLVETEAAFFQDTEADDIVVDFCPLGVPETAEQWEPLRSLALGPRPFRDVDVAAVSAFVVIRVTHGTGASVRRLAFAQLNVSDVLLADRDAAARRDLISQSSSEDILAALVFGVGRVRSRLHKLSADNSATSSTTGTQAISRVGLESMLQAIAERPELLTEIGLLLGHDEFFCRFREDLQHAISAVEVASL